MVQIYGLDFTSAPKPRKPITCAVCDFDGKILHIRKLETFTNKEFSDFEEFLARPGEWIAGLDFPFGQPATLIEHQGWERTWEGCVGHIGKMTKEQWVETLTQYCNNQLAGQKYHFRTVDKHAKSCSPMMLYGVPVAKMFFEGAPRLLNSGANIMPCCPRDDSRILLEAYPAIVARKWIDSQGYKSDTRKKQTPAHRGARQQIVDGIRTACRRYYGFDCDMDDTMVNDFVTDGTGDKLDAFLCAIQAAWAYTQRTIGYGIPIGCNSLEGWIIDPLFHQL